MKTITLGTPWRRALPLAVVCAALTCAVADAPPSRRAAERPAPRTVTRASSRAVTPLNRFGSRRRGEMRAGGLRPRPTPHVGAFWPAVRGGVGTAALWRSAPNRGVPKFRNRIVPHAAPLVPQARRLGVNAAIVGGPATSPKSSAAAALRGAAGAKGSAAAISGAGVHRKP